MGCILGGLAGSVSAEFSVSVLLLRLSAGVTSHLLKADRVPDQFKFGVSTNIHFVSGEVAGQTDL